MFRLLRTLRHLRPSQVLWRLRYARERRRNLARGSRRGRWTWTDAIPPPICADLLALALLLDDEAARDRLRHRWTAMAEHLAWMRHPDGDIPLLNDSALGGSSSPATMLGLGEHLGIDVDARPRKGGKHFPDTGVVAWHGSPSRPSSSPATIAASRPPATSISSAPWSANGRHEPPGWTLPSGLA